MITCNGCCTRTALQTVYLRRRNGRITETVSCYEVMHVLLTSRSPTSCLWLAIPRVIGEVMLRVT